MKPSAASLLTTTGVVSHRQLTLGSAREHATLGRGGRGEPPFGGPSRSRRPPNGVVVGEQSSLHAAMGVRG